MITQNSNILKHPRIQKVLDIVPRLFRNFPPEDFRAFLLCGHFNEYDTGDTISSDKEITENRGFLIIDGNVSFFMEDVLIARLNEGDFIGETFLFKKSPINGILAATGPSAVLHFDKDDVLKFFEQRSDRLFKIFIMNLVEIQNTKLIYAGRKIMHLQKKLIQISGNNV